MLREQDAIIRRAMILFDCFIILIAFVASYFLRTILTNMYALDLFPSMRIIEKGSASFNDYLVILVMIVLCWSASLNLNGMYHSLRLKQKLDLFWIIIKSAFFVTASFGALLFIFKIHFVSRAFFAIFMLLSSFLLFFEKLCIFGIMHYVRRQGYNFRRILIVGTGRRACDFIEKINNHPEWGIKILGSIDDDPENINGNVKCGDIIGVMLDLPRILHKHAVDEVVFILPRSRLNFIEEALHTCEREGVKATIAVDLFDFKLAKSFQTEIDGIPLITFETTAREGWQLFVKRAIDILVSGALIILLSPLYVLVAIAIKLTSRGPVLFIQRRVGLNGRKFILFKFRTMVSGAHLKVSSVKVLNEMSGPIFKIKKDPRITSIGRFLRKSSIDELPQLFNVFVGHMSLVGPRPPLSHEVSKYRSWQRRRLSMRPGLTCIWQIKGRNKVDFTEWMKMDLEYIDNWSLSLDFKILIKTIPVVLFGIGAY